MILSEATLKARYLKRIAGARDKKVYIGPEDIALDINNSCNLTCQYCWFHAPGSPAHFDKALFFPWEKFIGIVSDAVDLNVDHICITGSGEPTMHPRFRDMMQHLEKQPLNVKVLTNATFPLEYCSDVIKGDSVLIDLSAVNRQQYQDLQGKDLFDRVLSNIERLAFLRDTSKPEFKIDIVYIVNATNIAQNQEMQELASKLGVNSVQFKTMDVHDYNQGIALTGRSKPGSVSDDHKTPPVCLNGWFYMLIKADDNNARTCCMLPKLHLSALDKLSFKQIWLSKQTMNMRLLGKFGQVQKMNKGCRSCPFYDRNVRWAENLAGVSVNEQAIT